MKKYIDKYENIYIVAERTVIKSIYKKMVKAKNTNLVTLFSENPEFSQYKEVYAICIESITKWFYIVNSDDILYMILKDDLQEYKGLI